MISGATRFSARLGEDSLDPSSAQGDSLGQGGQFVTSTINKAFGSKPVIDTVQSESALVNTWRALGPGVQAVAVVLGGLYVIKIIRGVL